MRQSIPVSAEERGVGLAHLLADDGAHLVVEVREVPLLGRLDDAVERDEQAAGDGTRDFFSFVVRPLGGAF
ncbi:MAG: hypothetical protein ABIW49_04690 [Knoellia sp.]